MSFTRLLSLSLVTVAACATPKPSVPLEAPNVQFKKAVVVAAVASNKRAEIEDLVANEIQRRRPGTTVIPTYKPFPDLGRASDKSFRAYLNAQNIDIVVTIVPFLESTASSHDDWSDVAGDELVNYYDHLSPTGLTTRMGVQVVGWDVRTGRSVYAKTSQIEMSEPVGTRGVADFAVETVTRTR